MRKIIALSFFVVLVLVVSFVAFEGTLVSASSTDDVTVSLNVGSEITLTCGDSVNLGSISGMTGGTVTGSVDCTTITNNANGYTMSVRANTNPALKSTNDSFADFTTSSPATDWSVASAESKFGYTVSSTDAYGFKYNGSACGSVGTASLTHCYKGFYTGDQQIVSGSVTPAGGTVTTIGLTAQSGSARFQSQGSYSATITVTASTS